MKAAVVGVEGLHAAHVGAFYIDEQNRRAEKEARHGVAFVQGWGEQSHSIARRIDIASERFEASRLGFVPESWAENDRAEWKRLLAKFGERSGNEQLTKWADVAMTCRGLLVASEDDLVTIARFSARMCEDRFLVWNGAGKGGESGLISWRALEAAQAQAVAWGITLPADNLSEEGMAARLSSDLWWLHGLRKSQRRMLEQEARRRGYVHRKAGIYVSDEALKLRRAQRRRCADVLARFEMVGLETGTVISMADVAAAGMANPDNRRAELMTRIRGFEEIAIERGDVCEFVTLTCPSAYHERTRGGGKNGKYNGATPRDAQAYLCKLWAKVRAWIGRSELVVYGLRIAEPHHDGTPHWHMALFVSESGAQGLRECLSSYALEEDGEEAGAADNRIKFVAINPAKGSAAGYVLKYVCKNLGGIDGEADYEGGGASDGTAERVEAWASTWGIRQFQQVGGHHVGAWRELRRIAELDGSEPEQFADAWAAANPQGEDGRADWAGFIRALGGVETKARDALVWLEVEGEEMRGRYGMELYLRPKGVGAAGVFRASQRERWEVRAKAARG